MDPNSRPSYFYDSQGNLALGIASKPNIVSDASGYTTSMGIYTLPVATPPPLNPVTTPSTVDVVTLTVNCCVTDIVIVVGKLNWQCYMCNESHSLDTSIDKHLSLKHGNGLESCAGIQPGGDNPQSHSHNMLAFQGPNTSSSSSQYTGSGFIGNQQVPTCMATSDINQGTNQTKSQTPVPASQAITQMLTIPQADATSSGRSGLEREVALLMAQTFTQSGEMSSSWDTGQKMEEQSSVPTDGGNPEESKAVLLTELTNANRDGSAPQYSTLDDQAKGAILGKMINKVEKAIPSVADTDAKNGLFLVATELARMKKQTKSKRMLLRTKYRYINCPECGKEVRNRRAYIAQHNRSHEKGKNFHCSVCNKMFKYKSTLRRHVQQQGHEGGMDNDNSLVTAPASVPQWEGSNISQEDTSTSTDNLPAENNDSVIEDGCKDDGTDPSVALGVQEKSETVPDALCPSGEAAYDKILSTLLIRGEQARSSTGKKLSLVQCFVCDREIRNRNYYITRHARCHMQDVLYTCPVCQMHFFRRDFFKQHMQQHGVVTSGDPADSKESVLCGDAEEQTAAPEKQVQPQLNKSIATTSTTTTPTPASISDSMPITTIDATLIAMPADEPILSLEERAESPLFKNSKISTVPCKICGKEIFNRSLNIKRHAQQHSIFEWETILSKPDASSDLTEECHPILRVVGSPVSPRLKITTPTSSPVTKASIHQFRCHICSKQFKSYVKKRRHMMQHGTTFTCPLCWIKFENYTLYRTHQQGCRKPGTVSEDGEGKPRMGALLCRQREKREKYTCSQCDAQIINTKQSIARHMRELHSEGQVHTCSKCGRVYDSYHKMQRHIKSHGDTGGICDVCGKVFLTKQALRNHTKLHTGPEGMYQCSRCPKSFRFQGLLDRHMRKHKEDTDICPHCGKVYISKVHLQRHISVVHLGVKDYRFKCDQCGAQFFESIQLRDHIAYRHHGIQLYQCKFCHKGFNCRPTMVRHERKMHTGYLPYVCKHCGQGFPEKSKLVSHEMTHTGVSPHKCDVCGKYFTTGSALKTHKNLHLGLKPYGCSICGRAYIKRWHLQQHLRKSHSAMGVAWQEITQQSALQPDEQLAIQQAEEQLALHPPDGHLTLHPPDGQLTIQQTDGQITVHQADGHLTLHQQDGHLTMHHPDRQLVHQTDAQLVHQPNTQLIVHQTDGHLTVHQTLEHIAVQHQNIVYH